MAAIIRARSRGSCPLPTMPGLSHRPMPAPCSRSSSSRRTKRHGIEACLASVAFADEWIVVVDSSSSDDTAERAPPIRRPGLDQRLAGLRRAEAARPRRARAAAGCSHRRRRAVTPELGGEHLRTAIAARGGAGGLRAVAAVGFCGRWMRHGDWYPDRVLRLFRRDRARFSDDRVHERVVVEGGPTGGSTANCCTTPCRRSDDALAKMNRYSSESAARQGPRRAARRPGRGAGARPWASCAAMSCGAASSTGCRLRRWRVYVAEGTYCRYLKIAEHARRLPTEVRGVHRVNQPQFADQAHTCPSTDRFCTAAAAFLAAPARAQFRVEISGVGATQLPIAIARFRDEDAAASRRRRIMRADLERSGVFRSIDARPRSTRAASR